MMVSSDPARARALDEVLGVVGHARPHLADAFDAVALLESLGYTDTRVQREVGLPDTRALGEYVFERLADRALPVMPAMHDAGAASEQSRSASAIVAPVAIALVWIATAVATRVAITPVLEPLPYAVLASLVIWGGFMEAMRRRGGYYARIGQPHVARVTCWYFIRLGALVSIAVAAAGVGVGAIAHAPWPYLTLWADAFLITCAAWTIVGALHVPGALSLRRQDPTTVVPIPRMTILAFHELRTLGLGALLFLAAAAPRLFYVGVQADAAVLALLIAAAVALRRI